MNKNFLAVIAIAAITTLTALPAYAQQVEVFPQIGHVNSIYSVAFSPDGKLIVSGSNDYTVKLWDIASGREIRAFTSHTSAVHSVAFSPNGKQILSGSADSTIKLWDVATGKEIRTFTGHETGIESVAFTPNGKQVLSVDYKGTVKLWDVAKGKEVKSFKGYDEFESPSFSRFSPDGKQIIYGGWDDLGQYIQLWDVAKGKEIKTFTIDADEESDLISVASSPNGKQVLSGFEDGDIKLWDVAKGKEIRTFTGHTDKINSVAFSPNGKQIVSACGDYDSNDSSVKLWDTATGKEIATFSGHKGRIWSVTFSPDGKQIASGAGGLISNDKSVKLWDIASGTEIKTFGGQAGGVWSTAFSPDGKLVVAGLSNRDIELWDTVSGRKIRTFEGHHTNPVGSISFSPDGKQILSEDYANANVKLWDVATGKEIRTFPIGNARFSPDGKQMLSSGSNNTVKLWDIASGREIRTFAGHKGGVSSVAFSPDGKQIVSGSSDWTVKLWDVATGTEIKTFAGHTNKVWGVAFSPDGKQILSRSDDGTTRLWDVATGKEIRTFPAGGLCFSPDGKQILGISKDTLKLWDVATGKEEKISTGHRVDSASFSRDGKRIVSGSWEDGAIRLWDVATGKEIAGFVSFSGSDSNLAQATRGLTVETTTAATSNEGEWLAITPDGFYQASPRGDRYLNVRVGDTVTGIDSYRSTFYNPDIVQARLAGKPDPASKTNVSIQDAAKFAPPTVTIQSPTYRSVTNTATANLSVNIVDSNQPLQNIKILVNGRLLGQTELAAVSGKGLQAQKASLSVTGNLKAVKFDLPITLDPGQNIIEVVAFNGYSESPRQPVKVTWNAPAGQKPALPNLWVLSVGVNNYTDAGINNLRYCVADAKGVIDSLKAQEGLRYAKVNSLLIADGEAITPTAANIKQNLSFLDQAGERDVVLLFLAGHGVSDNAGKFLFLAGDVSLKADKSVNEANTLTDGDIVKVLDRAGNLLVFIDACQSGGVDNDRLVRSLMETNAFVFASSRGNEFSQEKPELGHGVFTYSIMDGLKGAPAAKAQGNVTVLSLSGFVSTDVPKRTNGAQNPKAYSLGFWDFPMAVVK